MHVRYSHVEHVLYGICHTMLFYLNKIACQTTIFPSLCVANVLWIHQYTPWNDFALWLLQMHTAPRAHIHALQYKTIFHYFTFNVKQEFHDCRTCKRLHINIYICMCSIVSTFNQYYVLLLLILISTVCYEMYLFWLSPQTKRIPNRVYLTQTWKNKHKNSNKIIIKSALRLLSRTCHTAYVKSIMWIKLWSVFL